MFAPSNVTNPVPVFVMPVAPPIPIVLVPASLNEYATELLLNDTEAGNTPLAWTTTVPLVIGLLLLAGFVSPKIGELAS